MHLTGIMAENYKRLKLVDLKFDPKTNAIIISGDNRQGKSTLLDAVKAAMGGAKAVSDEPFPIRRGETHAKVVVQTDELIITRTWTEKGSYLTVTNKEGWEPKGGVQALLDKLYSAFSFDPLAFSNMKPDKQRETLLKLVNIGLDLGQWKRERDEKYDARTVVNREVTDLEGQLKLLEKVPAETPDEEVSTATVLEEQAKAQAILNENNEKRRQLEEANKQLIDGMIMLQKGIRSDLDLARAEIRQTGDEIGTLKLEIEGIERTLAKKRENLASLVNTMDNLHDRELERMTQIEAFEDPEVKRKRLSGPESLNLTDPDMTVFAEKIKKVENTNRLVRIKKSRARLQADLTAKSAKSDALTESLDILDKKKANALAAAKMPIEGLSFDDNGLLYNGIPASQWSDEEAITISTAMGMALNPKLKAMFIREASLMSAKSRETLIKMATENGYQVFMEVVDTSGTLGIYIEDGEVKAIDGQAAQQPKAAAPKKEKK